MTSAGVGGSAIPFFERRDAKTQNTLFVGLLLFAAINLYYFLHLYRLYFIPLIAILFYLAYAGRASRLRVLHPYPAILILCYLYLLIAISWSPERSEGLYKISIETVYFSFALLPTLGRVCTDDMKFRVLQAASLAYCGIALYNFLTIGSVIDPAFLVIRSAFGAVFLASVPAHVYLYSKRNSRLSLATLIAIGAIAMTLGNRTLLLGGPPVFLASVLVVARERLVSSKGLRQRLGMALLIVPVLAFVAGEVYLSDVYSRIRNQTSFNIGAEVLKEQFSAQTSEDIERRIYTFVSIEMFLDHPVFGAGYASSPYYVHRVSQYQTVAHGLPFMLLAETGLAGAALFSLAIYWSLRGYWLKLRASTGADERSKIWMELLTLFAILIVGFSHQIYDDVYFYIFLGTGLYYRSQMRALAPFKFAHRPALTA
jgi:hypothetical protein